MKERYRGSRGDSRSKTACSRLQDLSLTTSLRPRPRSMTRSASRDATTERGYIALQASISLGFMYCHSVYNMSGVFHQLASSIAQLPRITPAPANSIPPLQNQLYLQITISVQIYPFISPTLSSITPPLSSLAFPVSLTTKQQQQRTTPPAQSSWA